MHRTNKLRSIVATRLICEVEAQLTHRNDEYLDLDMREVMNDVTVVTGRTSLLNTVCLRSFCHLPSFSGGCSVSFDDKYLDLTDLDSDDYKEKPGKKSPKDTGRFRIVVKVTGVISCALCE